MTNTDVRLGTHRPQMDVSPGLVFCFFRKQT